MSYMEQGHLGGYIVGGDSATYYPELWTWLIEELGIESMIDVGCGEGHALRFFEAFGCGGIGIEGTPQEHPQIVQHDYTTGSWPDRVRGNRMEGATGLAWCCEFVEHIEERYVPNFLETFLMSNLVLMTHAEPDQPGYHHVNCQTADYWKGAMAAIGYAYDEILTATTRELARANPDPHNHYVRSGLAFRRYE